jgi:hypothetical protein
MLTYKDQFDRNRDVVRVFVYLGRQRIGSIVQNGRNWQYVPKAGMKFAGPILGTIRAVKNSLESEQA